jgi:hypothetical protein
LIALNRFQQQHAPEVSVPEWNTNDKAEVCETDRVRAAVGGKFSTAVDVRQNYGREMKQSFYQSRFPQEDPNPAAGMTFTNDLEKLSGGYDSKTLNDKITVIYIDGNSFSSIQNRLLLSTKDAEAEQKSIDVKLKGYRREFLRNLLAEMKSKPELWRNKEDGYRLEVLMWGGDEMLLVVPAWLGWRTASLFYKTAKDWELGEPLKHAMGLVFCHHNAPIHRIRQLAIELAELAKESDRTQNLIAYAVLETFDHAGSDLEAYLRKRFPGPDAAMLLNGEKLDEAICAFAAVESDIPRSKVYLLVRLLLEQLNRPNPDDKERAKLAKRIEEIDSEIRKSCRNSAKFQDLEDCLGGAPGSWAHVLELWDYLRN